MPIKQWIMGIATLKLHIAINHACRASLPDRDWIATHNDRGTKSLAKTKFRTRTNY
ncbi:MAG: hypothetical protein HRT38_11625 [Alteromonadaceae bacterium]|nr:hypothetical protein [Alteromonadaceae bacterium]